MGVLRDWVCKMHGRFESMDERAKCPSGCSTVTRAFLQAPAISRGVAKRHDAIANMQMRSMNLTDMSNAQGRSVTENLMRKQWGTDAPDMRPRTVEVGTNLGGAMQAMGIPVEDRSHLVKNNHTLAARTSAYVDPRGDPK